MGSLLAQAINLEFNTRIIFKLQEGIEFPIAEYSSHIFMYRKPIELKNQSLLLDQPNSIQRETDRRLLVNTGFLVERIEELSLEDRLSRVRRYEYDEFY